MKERIENEDLNWNSSSNVISSSISSIGSSRINDNGNGNVNGNGKADDNADDNKRNETTSNIRHSYVVTGVVANARISPLLPIEWVGIASNRDDVSDAFSNNNSTVIPSFLWENSPRQETKCYRDDVKVYSHLPNGINILDSKWVLARIFGGNETIDRNPLLATCETHCFCGLDGFNAFARSVKLLTTDSDENGEKKRKYELEKIICNLPDLAIDTKPSVHLSELVVRPPINILNWWVVKDAAANGAGGVWVVGRKNAKAFGVSSTSPIYNLHKYVAQQYVWPPVLYDGKKCHVRSYVTITCDGQAFIHRRAFLHVANAKFTVNDDTSSNDVDAVFDDCVHITNCCANSGDAQKFAGEILADFCETEYTTWKCDGGGKQQPVIPLANFFPSVQATVFAVLQKHVELGFIDGGQKHNGFEYCGMDFMLSYKKKEVTESNFEEVQPVAYLLEINSPPSQDTASSLPHAEDLHNEVLRDWINFWVVPKIDPNYLPAAGGWQHCSVNNISISAEQTSNHEQRDDLILPSKATILNKIRWALFESKVQKNESKLLMQKQRDNRDRKNEIVNIIKPDNNKKKSSQLQSNVKDDDNGHDNDVSNNINISTDQISSFARSQFPFFSSDRQKDNENKSTFNGSKQQQQKQQIFFENAGGTQVPQSVIDSVSTSLTRRHREIIGSKTKAAARETLRRILVGDKEKEAGMSSVVILGLNATSLLESLAQRYGQMLSSTDEVVLSTENHLANFEPWLVAATTAGATIKIWTPFGKRQQNEQNSLLSPSPLSLSNYITSSNLDDLITPHTRLVAIPHASNILGSIRPISATSKMIKYNSKGYAHVVVDGVAVAPHIFVGLDENFGGNVDWYVVSMHKLFGPHLGCLLAHRSTSMEQFFEVNGSSFPGTTTKEEILQTLLESGTANIEGCAGVVGLGVYFKLLSNWYQGKITNTKELQTAFTSGITATDSMVTTREVRLAYSLFRKVERALLKSLIQRLSRYLLVRIIDRPSTEYLHFDSSRNSDRNDSLRLPTISFVHKSIPSCDIYTFCYDRGILCRNGFFLCTNYLSADLNFADHRDGVFRISLAHYNTFQEVEILCDTFEKMPRWAGVPASNQIHI